MKIEIREMSSTPPAPRAWEVLLGGNEVGVIWDKKIAESLVSNFGDEYLKGVLSTESVVKNAILAAETMRMLHASLGLSDEAGEIAKAIKSSLFYGTDLDRDNLKEEVGDALWYLGILLDTIGCSFEEAMAANNRKLRARYPDKFDADRAINRDLEKERKALEGEPQC